MSGCEFSGAGGRAVMQEAIFWWQKEEWPILTKFGLTWVGEKV